MSQLGDRLHVRQKFGWGLECISLLLLVVALFLVLRQPEGTDKYLWIGALFAAAMALLGLRWFQRKRFVTLINIRSPEERALLPVGRFIGFTDSGDYSIVVQHPANTFGPIVAWGGLTFLLFGLAITPTPFGVTVADRVLLGIGAMLSGAMVASVIKTRIFCRRCVLRGGSEILISKQDAQRMFQAVPEASFAEFAAQCLVLTEGHETEQGLIHRVYFMWSLERKRRPVDFRAECKKFCEDNRIAIRPQGRKLFCVGVRLLVDIEGRRS